MYIHRTHRITTSTHCSSKISINVLHDTFFFIIETLFVRLITDNYLHGYCYTNSPELKKNTVAARIAGYEKNHMIGVDRNV